MEVVPRPNPDVTTILEYAGPLLFCFVNPYAYFLGVGEVDYLCGACGVTVAERTSRGKIANMVLRCAKCRSYNSLRGS